MADADLAKALPEIREDVLLAAASWTNDRLVPSAKREAADELAHWAPRLLAAVEAVLALAEGVGSHAACRNLTADVVRVSHTTQI